MKMSYKQTKKWKTKNKTKERETWMKFKDGNKLTPEERIFIYANYYHFLFFFYFIYYNPTVALYLPS